MNEATFSAIAAELSSELTGSKFGKIFPLTRNQIIIDLRLPDSKYLFISIEPNSPRMYLVIRRFRDLDAQSKTLTPFLQFLRNRLSGGTLTSLHKLPDDRIFRFEFEVRDDVGITSKYLMIAQFSGRSSNLFLLDERGLILTSTRETSGPGQEVGDEYSPPAPFESDRAASENAVVPSKGFVDLSTALDSFYLEKETRTKLRNLASTARASVKREIRKSEKLLRNLEKDLSEHGSAEHWKRCGDLLLANAATARRENDKFVVVDYYAGDTPEIEIEADENHSIAEAAENYFKKYTKARNAAAAISSRVKDVKAELEMLYKRKEALEEAVADEDVSAIEALLPTRDELPGKRKKPIDSGDGFRRYTSSDGFEILVGRRSKDNDILTFKVARSLDLWLHAADYPGSHVVVRNPNRLEIPQRTLLEAAELAAFFSKAKSEPKAAVHYTQKKFVNKPKGAAPGLVSLASFKTLLVEPKNPQGGDS